MASCSIRQLGVLSLGLMAMTCTSQADKPEEVTPVTTKSPAPLLIKTQFPCLDSIQGLWRVARYNLFRMGDHYPSTLPGQSVRIGLKADSLYYFDKDTLVFKEYRAVERLTPAYSQPSGNGPFTYRLTSFHSKPTDLVGYYARFKGDTLFLFGSYDDGSDFWLVRDCP